MKAAGKTIALESHTDPRGKLRAVEGARDIPFEIRRVFMISEVPADAKRGEHAYMHNEFLICAAGSCTVEIDDGKRVKTCVMDSPGKGLLIPAGTWRTLYGFSPDCVLTVLSDAHYSTEDYVFDKEAFKLLAGSGR